MSHTQPRDATGRYAPAIHGALDDYLRSGAEVHGRTIIDAAEPLSMLAAPERGEPGDKYCYAVAVRAVVRWDAGELPERVVEVEYVTPDREGVVVREVRGRVGCSDGRVGVSALDFASVPWRIAVSESETDALDVGAGTREAFGDALRAHEEVLDA